MKVLLKFSIGNKQYGILTNNNNEANSYINRLTNSLVSSGILTSMRSIGRGKYDYRLRSGRFAIYKRSVDNSVRYILTINNVKNGCVKSYVSTNISALKRRAHETLETLGCRADPRDDEYGEWSVVDNINSIYITTRIMDDTNKQAIQYIDLLQAIKHDPSILSLPILGEPETDPLRGVVKTKNIRAYAIAITLGCITTGPFGQISTLALLFNYTNDIIQAYGNDYAIKAYLQKFCSYPTTATLTAIAIQSALVTFVFGALSEGRYIHLGLTVCFASAFLTIIVRSQIGKKISKLEY